MKGRTKRVILFSMVAVFIVAVATVFMGVVYVVKHPQSIKGILEKSLASMVQGDVTIEHIRLDTAPFNLRLSGIHLTTQPQSGRPGVVLELGEVSAALALRGPFGQRRLVVESLRLNQPSVELTGFEEKGTTPDIEASPGPLNALLTKLFKTLVFKEVIVDHGEIVDGEVKVGMDDKHIRIGGLNVVYGANRPLHIFFGVELITSDQGLQLSVPLIRWDSNSASFKRQQPMEGTLTVEEVRLKEDDLKIDAAAIELKLAFNLVEDRLNFKLIRSIVSGLHLEQGEAIFDSPEDIHFTATGHYNERSKQILFEQWMVEMAEVLKASGVMQTEGFPPGRWSAKVDHARVALGPFFRSLGGKPLPIPMSEIALEGIVQASGLLWAIGTPDDRQLFCDLEASSEGGIAKISRPDGSFSGKWSGRIHVKGPVSGAAITSDLKVSDLRAEKGEVRLNDLSVECSVQGKYPEFRVKGLNLHLPKQNLALPKAFEIWPVRLRSAQALLDLKGRTMTMEAGSIISPLFGELSLASRASEEGAEVKLHGKALPWPKWISQPGAPLAGMDMSGAGDLEIKTTVRWAETAHVEGEIRYADLGFQDRNAIWSGQGVKVRTGIEARLDLRDFKIQGKVSLEVPKGELLLDRFYFNMSQEPFRASARLACQLATKQGQVFDVGIQLGELLAIRADATFGWAEEGDKKSAHVQWSPTPLQPLFERLLKDPFKLEHPRLDEIKAEGVVSGEMWLESVGRAQRVIGELEWNDGLLQWEDGKIRLEDVQLKLPLWQESGDPSKAKGPGDGSFKASLVKLPFLPPQSLSAALAVGPNMVSIPSPMFIQTPGGSIRVGETSCRDCFQPGRRVQTSLTFKAIDLKPFLPEPWSNLGLASMEGDLRPVEILTGTVQTKGRVKLSIFGGEILVSEIGVQDLNAPSPKFSCRIDAKELDLAQLTEDTEFGKIDGVLEGHIENAVFSGVQPQSFDLVVETVKRRGVPQRISVKAVDNIARIGGGTSPFVGIAGTFVSLFKELPYEKIGIRARLENDVFKINGTLKEDGKEYLVKRGGLAGVDVINQNPDNRIGFKDMIKRLKRVTTAPQGQEGREEKALQ